MDMKKFDLWVNEQEDQKKTQKIKVVQTRLWKQLRYIKLVDDILTKSKSTAVPDLTGLECTILGNITRSNISVTSTSTSDSEEFHGGNNKGYG